MYCTRVYVFKCRENMVIVLRTSTSTIRHSKVMGRGGGQRKQKQYTLLCLCQKTINFRVGCDGSGVCVCCPGGHDEKSHAPATFALPPSPCPLRDRLHDSSDTQTF